MKIKKDRKTITLSRIVNRVIKEEVDKEERFINKIVKFIEPPYFFNLDSLGVPYHLYEKILSIKFGEEVDYEEDKDGFDYLNVYDSRGNRIYSENIFERTWSKEEYDSRGNRIYSENSTGNWRKMKYDSSDNLIYSEDENGKWRKYTYVGNMVYSENADGSIFSWER